MPWRVRRDDVEQFREQLWKDERSFVLGSRQMKGAFGKDCFDEASARFEAAVLDLLGSATGDEQLCPRVLDVGGSNVTIERVDGIRLFDLLRHLRHIELSRRDGMAEFASATLIARARSRLARIQELLLENAADLASEPYPLAEKMGGLLELLSRVLGIRSDFSHWRAEVDSLSEYWTEQCSIVPFRDGTPKNTLVAEPRLRMGIDADVSRRAAVEAILEHN